MFETRGKWAYHERAPTFPSAANMAVDEGALLMKGHKYHGGRGMIPNRSGSAPPNMEGSLAAVGHLLQNSGFDPNIASLRYDRQFGGLDGALVPYSSLVSDYSSSVGLRSQSQYSFTSGFEHLTSSGAGNQLRLTPFSGSSDNALHLYRSSLSTYKEESEDDRSPQKFSNELTDRSSVLWSGQESSSSVGHSRNVAEFIKDEFTCMSSPKNDKPNTVCHGSEGDGSNNHEQLTNVSITVESGARVDDTSLSSQGDHSASIFRPSSSDSRQGSSHSIQIDDSSNISLNYENEIVVSGEEDITYVQTGIKTLNLAGTPKVEKNGARGERPHSFPTSFVQHQMHQPITTLQYQSSIPQIVSHVTSSYVVPNQVLHGGKFFSTEAQPVLHSSGFTLPLYATAAASYMHSENPYYASVQQPGVVYPPQYGIGGYPYNPGVVPSYIGGYPTHNAVPLAFDGSTAAGLDINTHGTWGSSSQGVDMQHMNRFYGPHGFAPPVVDPRLQFHPSYGDFCNITGQVDPLALRGGVMENQDFASALPDHRPQHQGVVGHNNLSQPRGAFSGVDYAASSTNTGFFTHIMNSSFASPVLPGSPIGGSGSRFPGVRSVGSPHSGGSVSPYGSWQGHRGFEIFNHQKSFSFLEELKSGKGRRFELSDIVGHVVDLSVDQHGSRFIQQKLENCSIEDKQSVFQEILPHASKLMSDVFGNYVIQKFFEYGTPDQRRDLANALKGQILQLSLQMYGCRVIQKALDVIEVDQKTELVHELDGHVMRCVRDQNGNHVIQKCIECIPSERIGFIISSFRGQVASLSMHPYGCRVIQRILERCMTELETQFIVDEILESVCTLAQDQYGNYVTQHVLEKGKPQERLQIITNLSGKVVQMSQHKFASNVIEKCLDHGDAAGRELLIGEVIGQNEGNDNLLVMMKDQYANYVVQKILETCTDSQRDLLIGRIQVHLHGLKKYTYGKHIVARFEKLFGEMETPGS